MVTKTAILGIDLQNDFTSPSGSLFVKGADSDVKRIVEFINKNQAHIDYVALSLDSHQPIHIAHQCYWKDIDGNKPSVFTNIQLEDVANGKWIPQYNKELAVPYLEKLKKQGEVCTIWPMHCILGSRGWAIDESLIDCLSDWAIKNNKSYDLFYKDYNQFTEYYSIFKIAVEWEGEPEMGINTNFISVLNSYDKVLLVGEAADYCVANSLNDILDTCDELAKKIVVLTDCMSWINPDNEKAALIFEKAKKQGVEFALSTDYEL